MKYVLNMLFLEQKVLLVCGNIICIYIRVLDLGMYKLKVIFDISIEVDSNFLFEYLLDLIIILIEFVELKFIGRQFFYLFKLFFVGGWKVKG